MTKLVKNLKYLMAKTGWSDYTLAPLAGISQPTLFRILNGTSQEPRQKTINGIAAAFGISSYDLVHGDISDVSVNIPIENSPPPSTFKALNSNTSTELMKMPISTITRMYKVESHSLIMATRLILENHKSRNKIEDLEELKTYVDLAIAEQKDKEDALLSQSSAHLPSN